jgi:endonuclease/exonuclease/phosphatase family metal-dependent hydrolase
VQECTAAPDTAGVPLRLLTWNLYHGRDFPPDPGLFTPRSRILRVSERNATHVQVNRYLLREFSEVLCGAAWDIALLQESPPRWGEPLAAHCASEAHGVLTSRNTLGRLRSFLARINPDLIGANEGGSNLTLVRGAAGTIVERRALVLRPGPVPERRMMAFTVAELADGEAICISNLHASAGRPLAALAEEEVLAAAERSVEWAAGRPLVLGGDLNLRPAQSGVYELLAERFSLAGPTAPNSLDHLLVRGLTVEMAPTPWPPQRRELQRDGFALRLSDHAPVESVFEFSAAPPARG